MRKPRRPPILSDHFCDSVAELCFRLLPAMDSDDLAFIIQQLFRLAEEEVTQKTSDLWDAHCALLRQLVERERGKAHDAVRRQSSSGN